MRTSRRPRRGGRLCSPQPRAWGEGRGARGERGPSYSDPAPHVPDPPTRLDAPHTEVHVVVDPLPELGLIFGLCAGVVVFLPRIHHLVIDRPHADAMTRDLLLPAHRNRRTREEDAHGDVLRQIFELAHV